jgi:hypothetical protein
VNWRSGIFRTWMLATVIWVAATVVYTDLWPDLIELVGDYRAILPKPVVQPDQDREAASADAFAYDTVLALFRISREFVLDDLVIVLVPPLGALALGIGVAWIARGRDSPHG